MAAVAVWDHRPSPQELLEERLARGWRPTPTPTRDGVQVLGYAACAWKRGQKPGQGCGRA